MPRTLTTIPKLHGPFVPDPAWEKAGMTPLGQQLWIERTPRSRAVPLYKVEPCPDCADAEQSQEDVCETCNGSRKVDGERVWKTNPMNGELLYKMNKPEHYIHERMFYSESDGQGNQVKVDWAPPTEDQIAALQHEKAVAEMVPALASALVDEGLSAAEIVARLKAPAPEPAAIPVAQLAPTEPVPFDSSREDTDEVAVGAGRDSPPSEEL